METGMQFITLANGDTKPIEFYYLENTMYVCPWCRYATTFETGCTNPGCLTRHKTAEECNAAIEKIAKDKRELEARSYSAYLWGQSLRRKGKE